MAASPDWPGNRLGFRIVAGVTQGPGEAVTFVYYRIDRYLIIWYRIGY